MRQITKKIIESFYRNAALRIDNTETDGESIWLFGNKIAQIRSDGLWISTQGWKTRTTFERLNGLLGVNVRRERGRLFLNDAPWDGHWVNVAEFNREREWQSAQNDLAPAEVEFDVTSEWTNEGYSKPLHSIFHTLNESELSGIESKLTEAGISSKRMEYDTAGVYRPNYFVIVRPEDVEKSLSIIK